MRKKYLSKSPAQTRKLGKILAKEVLETKSEKGLVVGLSGDLGGGKTTFLQGFARGLRIKEKVLSPTFVILRRLKIKSPRFKNLYHIDCYRIQKTKEILDLDFKNIVSSPQNIVVIEWSDRVRKILPKSSLILKFHFVDKNIRKIWPTKGKS
jgi:tRNA threonylcarbamoyladenosine biosynthesis protein TsaE